MRDKLQKSLARTLKVKKGGESSLVGLEKLKTGRRSPLEKVSGN